VKKCITCKNDKDENYFTKDKTKPDGLYPICKECLKKKRNNSVIKKKKREYDKQYRLNNIIKLTENRKIYQKNIPNKIRAKHNREYRQRHREEFNKSQNLYIEKNKYKFAYRTVLRNFLVRSGMHKNNLTSSILGYSANEFKERMEINFKEGMNWNNYGNWHVDHKKPVSKFEKGTPANIVNALCNLQPLWAKDNLSKGSKLIKI
jgi:hypothetical protein